jgi:hypothetical protein
MARQMMKDFAQQISRFTTLKTLAIVLGSAQIDESLQGRILAQHTHKTKPECWGVESGIEYLLCAMSRFLPD